MGGRITLINSVLASLPLYYFSFFKAPKKVIKEMVRTQRNFLWGGSEDVQKMAWLRWSRICLPKESGGLGIRSMEIFNLALLGKRRWRLVDEKNNAWSALTEHLYRQSGALSQRQQSVWWKDLNSIDESLPYGRNWFSDSIKVKLGNGWEVRFWEDCWCSPWKLVELFPQLYAVSEAKTGAVAEFGTWEGDQWQWKLSWPRQLSDEEEAGANMLLETLKPIGPDRDAADKWLWG